MPYDRPTWDLTSVLYAVRPRGGYFSLSEPGRVEVQPDGSTVFKPEAGGQRSYLRLTPKQRLGTLKTLIELASQPR